MNLKIRIYKNNNAAPDQTITIPLGIVKIAEKLIPRKAKEAMAEQGIDTKMIADAAKSGEIFGTIAEIEDHSKNERTVISIE